MKKIASQTYYKTTQRDPLGIVTVTPLLMVIGPVEDAEYPVGMVTLTVTVLLLTTSPLLDRTCGRLFIIDILDCY